MNDTNALKMLTHMLGIDEGSLMGYLNWCLIEHLVVELSGDHEWITSNRTKPDALAQFKEKVEKRTRCRWEHDNLVTLYDRVLMSTERHARTPIRYEELLRLLINAPLVCSNLTCRKSPPEVILHIDHIFPASKGGGSQFENLQFLCSRCNLTKSNNLQPTQLWLRLEFLRPF